MLPVSPPIDSHQKGVAGKGGASEPVIPGRKIDSRNLQVRLGVSITVWSVVYHFLVGSTSATEREDSMLDRFTLTHSKDLTRGSWCYDTGGGVTVACLKCGGAAALNHVVDANGDVSPSLLCPHGCGWHEWVHLEGYKDRK